MARISLVIGFGLVLTTCALPGGIGGSDIELSAECGPVPMDWPVLNPPDAGFEPFVEDLADYVDENARIEFDMETPTVWSVVEKTGNRLLLFGRHVTEPPEGPSYRFARFEKEGEGWRATAWGGCSIQAAADGFGVATFQIDPENPPIAALSTLHVLANERACAGGEAPPASRAVVPFVVETDRSVEITVLVESSTQAQTCPSNPDFPLTIELSEPLGDRVIWDASMVPIEPRP